ncbi:MAG: ROK family protein [Verrucomicrobiaceae bacterium]|nr:ROK family protein [Verrucomicrobiaceae bacterium]
MSSDLPLALGIDFGGTSVKVGVCQGADLVEKAAPIPPPEFDGAAALIPEIEKCIASLRKKHPSIAAIGAGLPGFVNWETGGVHALTNVDGWEGVNLKSILSESTGLPCIAENDANAMTYAEWRYGAGRGREYLLAITLGTGVGGGLILGGELYRGATYGAGEVGQISIDYNGRLGGHGNMGALERYVGNSPVTDLAMEKYQSAGQSLSEQDCTPLKVAERAQAGDAIAIAVWWEVGERLAIGLANVLWVLNLDCVVIGGGMAKAGDLLLGPLRNHLNTQMDASFTDGLKLVPAQFSNEAGIIGAAALALDECQKG